MKISLVLFSLISAQKQKVDKNDPHVKLDRLVKQINETWEVFYVKHSRCPKRVQRRDNFVNLIERIRTHYDKCGEPYNNRRRRDEGDEGVLNSSDREKALMESLREGSDDTEEESDNDEQGARASTTNKDLAAKQLARQAKKFALQYLEPCGDDIMNKMAKKSASWEKKLKNLKCAQFP